MKKYLFFLACIFFYTNAWCQCTYSPDTTVCYPSGFPFYWYGLFISNPGPTGFSIRSFDGTYDSITYCMNVGYQDDPTYQEQVTICPSQLPYTWRGQSYNQAGTYTQYASAPGLCDSVITLGLNVRAAPLITSFYPDSGSTGESISITGNNLDSVTAVYFGSSPASNIVHVTSNNILATVGQGASGTVAVSTICNTSSIGNFKFISAPNNVGIGSTIAPSKLTVSGGDIYVRDVGSGIILKDLQGNCYRVIIGIDNYGYKATNVIPIPCP
jgi:hypothetical protein